MIDTELQKSIASLGKTVLQLSSAVGTQTDNAESLTQQMRESNERAATNSRTLRFLSAISALSVLTILLLGNTVIQGNGAQKAIRDCTTPQGKCAHAAQRLPPR